jgi:hypothetical protein
MELDTILKPILAMVVHGTDGSDGITSGIHLRWAFHYKFGFPPEGFKLYKRKSNLKNKNCIEIESIDAPKEKTNIIESPDKQITFKSFSPDEPVNIQKINIQEKPFKIVKIFRIIKFRWPILKKETTKAIRITNGLNISLLNNTSLAELHFYSLVQTTIQISAKSGEKLI